MSDGGHMDLVCIHLQSKKRKKKIHFTVTVTSFRSLQALGFVFRKRFNSIRWRWPTPAAVNVLIK